MNRRHFLKTAGLGLGGLLVACNRGAKPDKPNIILCMADDQGWGDMGYYDHPVLKTPHFDAMASEALRFDRFYAAAPVCSPTRGSVMTGRHPNRFGCFKWGHTLRPQEITVAQALKAAGYVTGHFGKWHLGSVREGSPVNPGASGFDEWLSAPNFFENDPILCHNGKAVQLQGESSMVTVDAALEFIRRFSDDKRPFLAVVWFGSPHRPHEAFPAFQEMYSDQPRDMQHFYGEITAMDEAFGKLRNSLKELGIENNTLLWYCSDNGGLPNFGVTGGRGTKGDVYEGGLRVPALLQWPAKVKDHRVLELPCNTYDIYPTLLDIVGLEIPGQPPLDGISLLPLLQEKMNKRPSPMGFWNHPTRGIRTPSAEFMSDLLELQQKGLEIPRETLDLDAGEIEKSYPIDHFPGHSAWLDWPWKLHRIEEEDKTVTLELYDLENDPMEENDLSQIERDRTDDMLMRLTGWLESVVHSLNGKDYQI
ncbi:sulfatase-like hydrolase/transferase [candidate division KSB1 bacterium]|nr:sulfatase-like hydrolase/transferase [candidate division KSB1 bacterium]